MKKLGRKHRPFFRICAMDSRTPRDGRAIEELGTYDPMVPDADARVKLERERVAYWLSVGAQPSPKVAVLIRKYGAGGTHVDINTAALEKLEAARKSIGPIAPKPIPPKQEPKPVAEPPVEAPAEEAAPSE
jgi:small subunit ribosomal protein S16